jgi:hypothetical protein
MIIIMMRRSENKIWKLIKKEREKDNLKKFMH